jgi:hypothetical protein
VRSLRTAAPTPDAGHERIEERIEVVGDWRPTAGLTQALAVLLVALAERDQAADADATTDRTPGSAGDTDTRGI